MIAAQSLAGATSNGDSSAARPAELYARKSLMQTPQTYESLVALGVALLNQNKLVEALQPLNTAIGLFPSQPQAYVQRGILRFGLRDVTGARADLERAEHLDPTNSTASTILEEISTRLGE